MIQETEIKLLEIGTWVRFTEHAEFSDNDMFGVIISGDYGYYGIRRVGDTSNIVFMRPYRHVKELDSEAAFLFALSDKYGK